MGSSFLSICDSLGQMCSIPLGYIVAWDKLAHNMVLSSNEPKFLQETCKHEANRPKFPMET
jgi:hypothetical protein